MVSCFVTMSGHCRGSLFAVSLIFCTFLFTAEAQTSSPPPPPPAAVPCGQRSNLTCDDCLSNVTCLWCSTTLQCIDYPTRNILPPNSVCPLSDARWGVCWVNFQILIITMSVLAGVIIIAIFVCVCCCCKCERIGNKREDAKVERQNRARKARQKERRSEMQLRHDEIRNKYGLAKDNPYSRMNDH